MSSPTPKPGPSEPRFGSRTLRRCSRESESQRLALHGEAIDGVTSANAPTSCDLLRRASLGSKGRASVATGGWEQLRGSERQSERGRGLGYDEGRATQHQLIHQPSAPSLEPDHGRANRAYDAVRISPAKYPAAGE